ncbi:hypothetical protein [Flavobacterium limnophilum]|uniref:hypothetical protein n=1 Tax=Flavobacterium limnophilum TaxID=3003262 RepID=UPI0022AC6C6E|nr:hypothetical protein [Flavobacterium limnophilum]
MTTITINERTKAGKTLLELAKMLSVSNKGVTIESETVEKSAPNKTDEFLKKVRRSAKHAREIAAGTRKGIPLKDFLDEL